VREVVPVRGASSELPIELGRDPHRRCRVRKPRHCVVLCREFLMLRTRASSEVRKEVRAFLNTLGALIRPRTDPPGFLI